MVICPKCGCYSINGPHYSRGNWREQESLNYTCARCGYSESRPTLDQKKREKSLLEKMAEGASRPVSDR